jgi:DNA-binding LytR/AlgR family response regulator
MNPAVPTALIAEDEPLLARALQAELAAAWPLLQVVATVGDGASAVAQALALQPDVLFFDIRMPGLSGLEAAAELADRWPAQGPSAKPFPALVFVTAYDQYAIAAFEAQAVDYLVKPVARARLAKTVAKLQAGLARPMPAPLQMDATMDATLAQLRALMAQASTPGSPPVAPLTVIQAGIGNSIRMVPIGEVVYFEAADKYVRVLTAAHEYLIRTPLKELLAQLDSAVFWQIHRGTVVRASAIESVSRDEAGKIQLSLRDRADKLPVSRLYAHHFRAM